MEFALRQQLKSKSWIVNVLFYFACGLLVSSIIAYFIFFYKVSLQQERINQLMAGIAAFGSAQQRALEQEIFDNKKKIDDFAVLVKNQKITSGVFTFIEEKTLPSVWFSNFSLSPENSEIRLLGQTDSLDTLSKQFGVFEQSRDYVKAITVMSLQADAKGSVVFVLNLELDPAIFTYR